MPISIVHSFSHSTNMDPLCRVQCCAAAGVEWALYRARAEVAKVTRTSGRGECGARLGSGFWKYPVLPFCEKTPSHGIARR